MAATLDIRVNPKGAIVGAAAAGSALDRLKVKAAQTEGSFVQLGRSSDRLGLAYKALTASFAIGGILRLSDAYTQVSNRLQLVSKDQADAAKSMAVIKDLANETRAPLEATGKFYSQLALNAKSLNLTFDDTIGITRTLNQVIALTGQSTEASANALIQLQQSFGAGALRGDELRSVMEQIPLLGQLIADKMGIGVGQLKEFAEQGLVTSKVVADSLKASAEEIDKAFKKSKFTFSQAFTVLINGLTVAIGQFNEATGALQFLAKGIAFVGKNIGVLLNVVFKLGAVLATLWGVQKLIMFTTALAAAKVTFFEMRAGMVIASVTLNGFQLILARIATGFLTAATAARAFVLSNPFTAIAQAIVVVLGFLYTFREQIILNTQTGVTLGDVFRGVFALISQGITALGTIFAQFWMSLNLGGMTAQSTFTALYNALVATINLVGTIIGTTINLLSALGINAQNVGAALVFVLNTIAFIVNVIASAALATIDFVKSLFVVNDTLTVTGSAAVATFGAIGDFISGTISGIVALGKVIYASLVNVWPLILGQVQQFANDVVNIINQLTAALNKFTALFGIAAIGGTSTVTVKGAITPGEYFSRIKTAFADGMSSSNISNIFEGATAKGVKTATENWFSTLASGQGSVADTVADGANNVAKTTADAANNVSGTVANGTSSTVNAIDNLGGALSNVASAVQSSARFSGGGGGSSGGGGGRSGGGKNPASNFQIDQDPFYKQNAPSGRLTFSLGDAVNLDEINASLAKGIKQYTAEQVTDIEKAAKATAVDQAQLKFAFDELNNIVQSQVSSGVVTAAQAASTFSSNLSLIQRGFEDPRALELLRASGESLVTGIIDRANSATLNAKEFLEKTDILKGSGESKLVVTNGNRKFFKRIDLALDEMLTSVDFDSSQNPFEFLSKFATSGDTVATTTARLTSSIGTLGSGITRLSGTLSDANSAIRAEYDRLDLARKNVSPENYGGVNPAANIAGFAKGGRFNVGGQGGQDNNLVQFMASRGEEVEIRTKSQQRKEGSSSGSNQNIRVVFEGVTDIQSFRQNRAEIESRLLNATRRQQRQGR